MSGSSTNSGCLGEGSVSGSAKERQPRSCGGERGKEADDPALGPHELIFVLSLSPQS